MLLPALEKKEPSLANKWVIPVDIFPSVSHWWSPKISMSSDSKKEDLRTLFLHSADRHGIISSALSYFTIELIHWNWKGSFEWSNGKFQSIFARWQPFPFLDAA